MAKQAIFIHGIGRSRLDMYPLSSYLKRRGYETHNFGYRSRKQIISAHADDLNRFIEKRQLGESELHFVTHSLGSIVLRIFSQAYGERYQFGRSVMLGPPNQGSAMARFVLRLPLLPSFFGPSLVELSDLQLSQQIEKLEVGILSGGTSGGRGFNPFLKGNDDGIVTVDETKLEGMKDFSIVPVFHGIMMFSPKVMRLTHHFLEHGSFE